MPSTLWFEGFDSEGRAMFLDHPANPGGEPPPGNAPPPPSIDAMWPAVSPRTISGLALPFAVVQVLINEAPFQTVIADQAGDWAVALNAAAGTYSVEARQQGADGQWSAYSTPVLFVIIPDEEPLDRNGSQGRDDIERIPAPPITAGPPGGGLLKRPFRRPPAWPTEKGY